MIAGHFPHVDEPARFARVLQDFLATTTTDRADLRTLRHRLLGTGGPAAAGLSAQPPSTATVTHHSAEPTTAVAPERQRTGHGRGFLGVDRRR